MKIALVYPPTCDPTAPYLALPALAGALRPAGVEVALIDANVEAWDALLRPAPLQALGERLEERLARLDRRGSLDHAAQREYLQLWQARGDAQAAPAGIAAARATFRDAARFYDPDLYEDAVATVESACRLISAAHAPLRLSFTGYRTPFSLTTPEEIAHDARPENDPFDGYVRDQLIPRLQAEGPQAIGISVCFPGQLQPAYAFALKIKQALPDVHLTCGGPGVTQLLIRHRGKDLLRALGPFDSAVVFEGETTLLRLCEAIERGAPLRDLGNLVLRDALQGARYLPAGHGAEDLRALPPPDFDGLPLDLYFSPTLTLPYDPTRGCYWGKCTFCHYGLAEVGTASYRERPVEACVAHLGALSRRHDTKSFYLSQDSVAPKTIVKLAQALSETELGLRWATDLKAEKYLTPERAEVLRQGGAVACAIGVESAAPRVLKLIDKGAGVETVRDNIVRLAQAGVAVEAMCFTDFPTETAAEAMMTLRFLGELRESIALYIVGEFDLTEGALVAQEPERFGLSETYHLDGDLLKTGLFYEERRPSKRPRDAERVDAALGRLDAGWRLHSYPFAGSLSTAHTVLYYDRFGAGVFRDLARRPQPGPLPLSARGGQALARFDLAEAAEAEEREQEIWYHLVRERRHVSREAYNELAAQAPRLHPSPRRYRFRAGEPPVAKRAAQRSRRPRNAMGDAG